jgi:hypothetical protein
MSEWLMRDTWWSKWLVAAVVDVVRSVPKPCVAGSIPAGGTTFFGESADSPQLCDSMVRSAQVPSVDLRRISHKAVRQPVRRWRRCRRPRSRSPGAVARPRRGIAGQDVLTGGLAPLDLEHTAPAVWLQVSGSSSSSGAGSKPTRSSSMSAISTAPSTGDNWPRTTAWGTRRVVRMSSR